LQNYVTSANTPYFIIIYIVLFTPDYIDENGYRYYHVLQYDTFLTIRQLHLMGMPLAQIKQYIETRSPERMVDLYKE